MMLASSLQIYPQRPPKTLPSPRIVASPPPDNAQIDKHTGSPIATPPISPLIYFQSPIQILEGLVDILVFQEDEADVVEVGGGVDVALAVVLLYYEQ